VLAPTPEDKTINYSQCDNKYRSPVIGRYQTNANKNQSESRMKPGVGLLMSFDMNHNFYKP